MDFKVGDKVMFGRTNGEKTLGEIVKINNVKLKIKQLETRGVNLIGTIWGVPSSMCTLVNASKDHLKNETIKRCDKAYADYLYMCACLEANFNVKHCK